MPFTSHVARGQRLVRRSAALILLLLPLVLLLPGCRREQAARPERPPAEIESYTTELLTVPVIYKYVGQTEASQQVDVRARVQGVVWDIGFDEGTSVTAGQFLFRIDPRPFEADMQIAEARAYQSKVAVQSAERDLNRTRSLQQSASVSREELDDATSAFENAVADMRLAEANLVKARLELSYTTVTAPIAGMVGRALKKPGDLVDATQNSLLCTLTAQNPMYVNFTIAEKDILERRNAELAGRVIPPDNHNYEVEIILLDGTKYDEIGQINFSDVTIDPQTGTGLIRAAFANPNGVLMPGQFVEVIVKGARRTNTVVVPQTAVMIGMQGTFVYVVDEENKVEMRPVEATGWEGQNWIIESGLKDNERVIINGTNKTMPGAEVKVTTETTALHWNLTPAPRREGTGEASAPAIKGRATDQTLPRDVESTTGSVATTATADAGPETAE